MSRKHNCQIIASANPEVTIYINIDIVKKYKPNDIVTVKVWDKLMQVKYKEAIEHKLKIVCVN